MYTLPVYYYPPDTCGDVMGKNNKSTVEEIFLSTMADQDHTTTVIFFRLQPFDFNLFS